LSLLTTGVVDTGGNPLPVLLTPSVTLPSVSTTLVVKLQPMVVDTGGAFLAANIFAIFRKFQMALMR
jgi:hypothetical protein